MALVFSNKTAYFLVSRVLGVSVICRSLLAFALKTCGKSRVRACLTSLGPLCYLPRNSFRGYAQVRQYG